MGWNRETLSSVRAGFSGSSQRAADLVGSRSKSKRSL